jgi:hypothetical protein
MFVAKGLTLSAFALSAAAAAAAFAMPSAAAHRQVRISHRPAAVLAALEAAHLGTRPKPAHRPKPHAARLPSVSLVDEEWVCDSPVDLASVRVTMTPAYPGGRHGGDAVHLESGCSGHIGKLTVRTSIADGVKIAEGAHDLTIGSGSIRCLAKIPHVHQDGVQAMGGTRITLRHLRIDCGRADTRLINSDLFIKRSGSSVSPPTRVVCVGCFLGGEAAHTVDIQASVRSGVVASTVCEAKYPRLSLTIGSAAVAPVDVRNRLGSC